MPHSRRNRPSDMSYLSVDWGSPVDWGHGLNKSLIVWLLPAPSFFGGTTIINLVDKKDATLDNSRMWTAGRTNRWGALIFNNIDTVLVKTPALTDLTISYWVMPNTTVSNRYISDFGGTDEFATIVGYQDGFYNAYGGSYPIGNVAASSQIPASGDFKWDMVTWTLAGTTLSGYVNGKQEMTGTVTAGDFIPSADWKIGSTFTGGAKFGGQISDVRLWSRSLSEAEVSEYYNLSLHGWPGLLNRWRSRVWSTQVAVGGTTPKGPLGHPLHGALGGPVG